LVEGLQRTINYAAEHQVKLGFEPEPGMFIDTMSRYQELLDHVDAPHFLLTLDVGHLHCLGETPINDHIQRWSQRIINVHIEDMVQGIHEHRMFGEGEMDFGPILKAFREIGYQGGLHVELSRHSHEAPVAARKAWEFFASLDDS
jgi:sugar phosphate isomerase/epimerase